MISLNCLAMLWRWKWRQQNDYTELATEEGEHVALIKVWLDKYPELDEDCDYDPPLVID